MLEHTAVRCARDAAESKAMVRRLAQQLAEYGDASGRGGDIRYWIVRAKKDVLKSFVFDGRIGSIIQEEDGSTANADGGGYESDDAGTVGEEGGQSEGEVREKKKGGAELRPSLASPPRLTKSKRSGPVSPIRSSTSSNGSRGVRRNGRGATGSSSGSRASCGDEHE